MHPSTLISPRSPRRRSAQSLAALAVAGFSLLTGAHAASAAEVQTVGWGGHAGGVFGPGVGGNLLVPTPITAPETATQVADAPTATFALTPDGVLGAGAPAFGALGLGPSAPTATVTTFGLIPGTVGATAVAANTDAALVLKGGQVFGFGRNQFGSAGGAVNTSVLSPTPVTSLANITAISAGVQSSLALRSDGTVWAWGNYQTLGSTAAVDAAGTAGTSVPQPVSLPAGTKAVKIAAGLQHDLALLDDGSVVAWGANSYGEIGDGSTPGALVKDPVRVLTPPAGTTITAVSAGQVASFALLSDGSFRAWGRGATAALGLALGTTDNVLVPTARNPAAPAAAYPPFAEIQAERFVTYARTTDGRVFAWGGNTVGELGTTALNYASPYTGAPGAAGQLRTEVPQRVGKLQQVPWLASGSGAARQIVRSTLTLQSSGATTGDAHAFFTQSVGTASTTRPADFTSTNGVSVISRVRITGDHAEDFSVLGYGAGDITLPYTVGASQSFRVRVRFTPTALGERNATLRLDADGETATFALQGYGGELPGNTPGAKGDIGAPGTGGLAGLTGLTGATGPAGAAGKDGIVTFASNKGPASAGRGRKTTLTFTLNNGTTSRLVGTTATATVPAALRAVGKRSFAIKGVDAGASRKVILALQIGKTAKLGTQTVKVRIPFGTRSITASAKVRVTRSRQPRPSGPRLVRRTGL